MLTFHPLTLRRRSTTADDAVCLELEAPPELVERYRYQAGQHLAVRATVDGKELRRTYSLVGPAGTALRLGVRVQGAMSRYLAEQLPLGATLDAMEPSGRFKPAGGAAGARRYVALASGSGITPVLSIIATLLAGEPDARVLLVYGNRTAGRAMFLDEVLELKNRYIDRFSAQFMLSGESQDVELFNGRLDGRKLRELAQTEFDPMAVDEYFICGPGDMVKELTTTLRELGVPGRIHFERFAVDAAADRAVPPVRAATAAGAAGDVEVVITMDGRRRSFSMPRDALILESAEKAGLALPYSCRAGVCSTCRAKVVEGAAAMDRNQALEDYEVQAGFVLCCQARPTTARIELSYDDK